MKSMILILVTFTYSFSIIAGNSKPFSYDNHIQKEQSREVPKVIIIDIINYLPIEKQLKIIKVMPGILCYCDINEILYYLTLTENHPQLPLILDRAAGLPNSPRELSKYDLSKGFELEQILEEMRAIRRLASTRNGKEELVDNIQEFLNSMPISEWMNKNDYGVFSKEFRQELSFDFSEFFQSIAYEIESCRFLAEMQGEKFETKLIAWMKLAEKRNKLLKKLGLMKIISFIHLCRKEHWNDICRELYSGGGKELFTTSTKKYEKVTSQYLLKARSKLSSEADQTS